MKSPEINHLFQKRSILNLLLPFYFLFFISSLNSQTLENKGLKDLNLQGSATTEYNVNYGSDGNGIIQVMTLNSNGASSAQNNLFSNPKSIFPYFDLRLIGIVTPVRDQVLTNGPGWAFAAIGAMESGWLRLGLGLYDLSEKNLVTCHGFDYNVCTPGNYQMAAAYFSRAGGPISENDNPYTGINCNSTCSPFTYVPVAYASEARFLPGDSAVIQQALLDYGAIATTMYYDNTYYNSSDYTYYYSGANIPNHGVLIVGWDDNKITAGGTGAWIVKNSFGSSWGEDGYFYVSYNDSQFLSSNAIFPGKKTWDPNGALYYYDKFGWIKNTGFSNSIGYGVVKYVATKNHMIQRVGTYASVENTILDFEVYDDFDGVNLTNLLDSVNNKLCTFPGYYTFDFDSAIPVNQGDDFYIKVKYNSPNASMPIPLESNSAGYVSNATIETGKCWISNDASTWTAIGNGTAELSDLCIKAYGIDTLQPIANFKANKTSIYVGDSVNFLDQSIGSPASWTWTFTGGTPGSSSLQNPQNIKYNTPGRFNVKLTISSSNGTHSLTKYFYIEVNVVPPIAKFIADETTIANGDTVNFTDLSEGNPISWIWNFPGGTPSTSTAQNPANIVYNTPGSYNVSLTITNPLATKTITKYKYINVIQNGACGTLSHRIISDSSVNYTFIGGSVWGYIAGHNSYGMAQYADRFENQSNFSIRGLYAKIPQAYAAFPGSTIQYKVWDENAQGKPGNEIYHKVLQINSITPSTSAYYYVPFDSLVDISGNYFVGFSINYFNPCDTIINNVMMNRPATFNTAYLYENGVWMSFFDKFGGGLGYTSLDMMVDMCMSPPAPFPFNVTGGGIYCSGGAGVDVGIDGSETDATYELFLDNVSTGIILQGTGNPLSFGSQTAVGAYTVVGTNAFGTTNMNGVANITLAYSPIADFEANDTIIGTGDMINFTDLSTNNPTSWSWNFSGGNPPNSALQSPTNILYNYMGFYDVSLTVTNNCGSDQMIKQDYIQVMPDDSLLVFGFLTYDNLITPQTPMNNVKMYIKSITQITLDSVITDNVGYYVFDSLSGGTSYIIEPYYDTKTWGGSNSGDALLIMLHFVGLANLTGLPFQAADVNADGTINSADALNVQQRFVGMIQSYVAGNWVPTFDTIAFNGHSQQLDIQGLCFGDVNQSYIPPMVRNISGVIVSQYEDINAAHDKQITIPVKIEENAEIGAISMIIDYNPDLIKINNVKMNGESNNLLYYTNNGELRISWFSLTPLNLQAGDIILTVDCSLQSDQVDITKTQKSNSDIIFNIEGSSIFSDKSGNRIPQVQISIPKLELDNNAFDYEFTLNNNYPNPFTNTTEINYTLPVEGLAKLQIYNLLGEVVEVLTNENQSAGNYKVVFDGSQMDSGIYYYTLVFEGSGKILSETKKMIIQ